MTRINVVPASELAKIHLIAEHYELPDIFKLVRRHIKAGRSLDDVRDRIPDSYCYGVGHQSFFIDKLQWCRRRWYEIKLEMKRRGVKVSDMRDICELYPEIGDEWYGDYEPTYVDQYVNRERIAERILSMQARGMVV